MSPTPAVGTGASPAWALRGTGTLPATGEGLPSPGATACIAASPSHPDPSALVFAALHHLHFPTEMERTALEGSARALPILSREGIEDNRGGGAAPTHHPRKPLPKDATPEGHGPRPAGPGPESHTFQWTMATHILDGPGPEPCASRWIHPDGPHTFRWSGARPVHVLMGQNRDHTCPHGPRPGTS